MRRRFDFELERHGELRRVEQRLQRRDEGGQRLGELRLRAFSKAFETARTHIGNAHLLAQADTDDGAARDALQADGPEITELKDEAMFDRHAASVAP